MNGSENLHLHLRSEGLIRRTSDQRIGLNKIKRMRAILERKTGIRDKQLSPVKAKLYTFMSKKRSKLELVLTEIYFISYAQPTPMSSQVKIRDEWRSNLPPL